MTAGLVGGRYVLGERLGSGGSADVHVATDVRLARRVAVRIERGPVPSGADPWADVRAAARLEHPHVVRVLDAGLDRDGRRYVVLDLVDGVTLTTLLRETGPLAPADALTVVAAVLDGLAHAHEHGVLHLDLSPSNVMVPRAADGSGRLELVGALLLDVAGASARAVRGDTVTVSPHYASPEVATAAPADARADLYSAGAVLHELVTGQPPYVRADPRAVLEAQVRAPVATPSARAPGVPALVDAIVVRAMAKDRAARYGDARAMRAEVVAAAARLRAVPAVTCAAPAPGWLPGGTRRFAPVRPAADVSGPVPAVASGDALGVGVWVGVLAVVVGVGVAVALAAHASPAPVALPSPAAVAPQPGSSGTAGVGPDGSAPVPTPAVDAPPVLPADDPGTSTEASVVPVEVPDVLGADLADVAALLDSVGLVRGSVTPVDGAQRADVVLTTDPAPGAAVAPGTVIDLRVASGMAVVPPVAGAGREAAVATLSDAGLAVDWRTVTDGPPGTAVDTVVRTRPAPGARVPVGGLVVLDLAAVAVPARPSPPAAPSERPSPGPPGAPGLGPGPTPDPTSAPGGDAGT